MDLDRLPVPGQAMAVRALAVLWALTLFVYLVHGLSYFPWLDLDPIVPGPVLVVLNILVCAAFLYRPENALLLVTGALLILFTEFSWHSWLGALAPWVPWVALGIAFTRHAPDRHRASLVVISLLLISAATSLHRMNSEYLNGMEFRPEGMFARAFPPEWQGSIAQYARPAAWLWLAGTILPVPLCLLRKWRAAFACVLLFGVILVLLYHVLFYGLFLLVCLWLYTDPTVLTEWRARFLPRRISPLAVYFFCQAGFFSWYLFWNDSFAVCLSWIAATVVVISAARPGKAAIRLELLAAAKAAPVWTGILVCWLLLPFLWAGLPAPFAATYFTARELRNPPRITRPLPDTGNCHEVRKDYALRWGYKIFQGEGGCMGKTYR